MSVQHKQKKLFIFTALFIWAASLMFAPFLTRKASADAPTTGSWNDMTSITIGADTYTDSNIFDNAHRYMGADNGHGCVSYLVVNPLSPDIGRLYQYIWDAQSNSCVNSSGHMPYSRGSDQNKTPKTPYETPDPKFLANDSFKMTATDQARVNGYRSSPTSIWTPQAFDTSNIGDFVTTGQAYYAFPAQGPSYNALTDAQKHTYYRTKDDGTHDTSRYISLDGNGTSGQFHAGAAYDLVLKDGGNIVASLPSGAGNPPGSITDIDPKLKATVANGQNNSSEIKCYTTLSNPLTYVICPIIDAAQSAVQSFYGAITQQLDINVNNYFDEGSGKAAPSALYMAWSSVRYIALSLIVVIALIMVLSQAMSLEIFDAYTIRKVLPRLVIAVIAISLSWELSKFAVQLANDVGIGIRALIELPFKGIDPPNVGTSANTLVVSGGIGTVALASTFGIIGTVSFIAVALIAVITAFATLIFRKMLIIMLVILAPFAIACFVLPNTQRVWKLWSDNFFKALMLFPLISLFIAGGAVFAKIAGVGSEGSNELLTQLIIFACVFGPFFMLPMAFKMAGGALAGVNGIAARGAAAASGNGLAGFRKGRQAKTKDLWAQRGARAKSGELMPSWTKRIGGGAINSRVAGLASGYKGGYGFGSRGQTAEDAALVQASRAQMKTEAWQNHAFKDDANKALTYESAGAARAAGLSEDAINSARQMAGPGGWSKANSIAAAQQLAMNKTGYADAAEAMETIERVSGGNSVLAGSLRENIKYTSKGVGRNDMGALSAQQSGETRTQWKNRMTTDGFENVDTYSLGREHGNSYKNMAEAHTDQYREAVEAYNETTADGYTGTERDKAAARDAVVTTRTKLEETLKNASSATGKNARVAARTASDIEGADRNLRDGTEDGGVSILGEIRTKRPNQGDAEGEIGSGGLARARLGMTDAERDRYEQDRKK